MPRIEFGPLVDIEKAGKTARVAGRCLLGDIHLGDLFTSVQDWRSDGPATEVRLRVIGISVFGKPIDEVGPSYTATLTLDGEGLATLRDRKLLIGTN